MKSIYKSRIDGLLLMMSILGVLSGITLGWKSLIWIIPMTTLWLFSHEAYSYESKEKLHETNISRQR